MIISEEVDAVINQSRRCFSPRSCASDGNDHKMLKVLLNDEVERPWLTIRFKEHGRSWNYHLFIPDVVGYVAAW